jgi:enoyl-CoA hydratase/carnithine racemase
MAWNDATGDEILYEVDGHVATLTFNRPDQMNTITGPMLDLLSTLLVTADRDPEIRCIVLTGAGRAWCAGLDVKEQSQGSGLSLGGAPEIEMRDTPPIVLYGLDTPIIAALNGGAAGYGLDVALACDIRIAARSAKLAFAFAKRGILPESGGTWLLPRIVGRSMAAELMLTGRTLDAGASLAAGLVSQVVDNDALPKAARAIADEIAANAPLATRAIKRMLRVSEAESFEAHVHHVFLQLIPLLRTKDFAEGVASFVERRPPEFTGR